MSDPTFMQQTYTFNQLVTNYLNEINQLRVYIQNPSDQTKLQIYYQAVNVFKDLSIKDIIEFALSFGRARSGKSAQMREAFPTILGYRVTNVSQIDIAYAQLLLDYTKAFKAYRIHLKEWLLRFILSSRFSPVSGFVDHEIDKVIENTQRDIVSYQAWK